MKALILTAGRSRKPVILSSVKSGAKLSTSDVRRATLSPMASFALQMAAIAILGSALFAAAVIYPEAVGVFAGICILVAIPFMMKGGNNARV